jgi:hypothetical protein
MRDPQAARKLPTLRMWQPWRFVHFEHEDLPTMDERSGRYLAAVPCNTSRRVPIFLKTKLIATRE